MLCAAPCPSAYRGACLSLTSCSPPSPPRISRAGTGGRNPVVLPSSVSSPWVGRVMGGCEEVQGDTGSWREDIGTCTEV